MKKERGGITGIVLYTQLVGGQTRRSSAGWSVHDRTQPQSPIPWRSRRIPRDLRIAALAAAQQRSRSQHIFLPGTTRVQGAAHGGQLPERELLFTPFSPINLLRDDSRAKQSLSVQVAAVI